MRRAALLLIAACESANPPPPPEAGRHVELVAAPANGDLASYVATEIARGTRDRVPVLVYVGATWCKPCREFHAAAEAGRLDAELGPLRLIEFDLDRDDVYLKAAGYTSTLVPLFARAGADGKSIGKQIEGVKQGRDYVEQLTPRVRSLIE